MGPTTCNYVIKFMSGDESAFILYFWLFLHMFLHILGALLPLMKHMKNHREEVPKDLKPIGAKTDKLELVMACL